jgi:tetratricopeptide (TPR) repeat protein
MTKDSSALRAATAPIPPRSTLPDVVKAAELCVAADKASEATLMIEAALARWPASLRLRVLHARLLAAQGRAEDAVASLRQAIEQSPTSARSAAALAWAYIRSGQVDEARALLARAIANGLDEKRVVKLEWAIATLPLRPLRPIVADRSEREVVLAERPGSDTAVIVFTGAAHHVGLPLKIFDHYLAALGVTAFYLKDFKGLGALKGIRSLGDRYAATLSLLHEMVMERGVKRVCTIGHSAGLRAAVRYGVDLDADSIIGISGATGAEPRLIDNSADSITPNRPMDGLSADMLDLNRFLRYRVYASKIELVYDPEAESENSNALYLSGLAGVRLHPVARHVGQKSIVKQLAVNGELLRFLAELLGIDSA